MCMIDLAPGEVWHETEHTARKDHVCSCCHGTIRKGKRYTQHFSIHAGVPTDEKMCATCTRVAARFEDAHGQRTNPSSMPQMLIDWIDEEELDNRLVALKWRRDLKRMHRRRQRRMEALRGTEDTP